MLSRSARAMPEAPKETCRIFPFGEAARSPGMKDGAAMTAPAARRNRRRLMDDFMKNAGVVNE
jgi:hypothetical protein